MTEVRKGFPSLETLVFCIVDTRLIMGAWWISWIDFPFSCRKIYIALNCETIRPPAPDNRWLGVWLYSWGESKGWGGGYSLTPLSGAGTPLVFRLWIVSDQNSNIESILCSTPQLWLSWGGNYRYDVQGLAASWLVLASCQSGGVSVVMTARNDLYLGMRLD